MATSPTSDSPPTLWTLTACDHPTEKVEPNSPGAAERCFSLPRSRRSPSERHSSCSVSRRAGSAEIREQCRGISRAGGQGGDFETGRWGGGIRARQWGWNSTTSTNSTACEVRCRIAATRGIQVHRTDWNSTTSTNSTGWGLRAVIGDNHSVRHRQACWPLSLGRRAGVARP